MTKFEQALQAGYSEEEIRDRLLERKSDAIKEASEKGYSPDEIFDSIEKNYGMPKSLAMGAPKADNTDYTGDPFLNEIKAEYELNQSKINKAVEAGYFNEEEKKLANAKIEATRARKEQDFMESKQAPTPEKNETGIKKDGKFEGNVVTDFIKGIQSEMYQPFSPAIDLAVNFLKQSGTAVGETMEKGINAVTGFNLDFYTNNAQKFREEGERINKTIDPEGKLLFKPTVATEIMASVAAPLGITNPKKMIAVEALMGYAIEMGDSSNIAESVKSGVNQAGAAAGGMLLIDGIMSMFAKKGTGNALEYLWDKHSVELREASGLGDNATKEEIIATIEGDWLRIMGGEGDNTTKVKAIVDRLGAEGAALKQASQNFAGKFADEGKIRQVKHERIGAVTEKTAGGSIEEGAEALAKQVGMDRQIAKEIGKTPEEVSKLTKGEIADTYNEFQKASRDKYSATYDLDEKTVNSVLEDLTRRAELSRGLSQAELNITNTLKPKMTIDELMSTKRAVNDLIKKSSGTALHNATQLKKKVDDLIKGTLDEGDYKMYSTLEEEYAKRMNFAGKKATNKLGAKLLNFVNKKQTIENITDELQKLKKGEVTFKQLEDVIGTKNVAKVEKGIVESFFKKNVDDVDYKEISDALNKMGFITKEGKELKQSIENMSKVFSADNFTNLNKKIAKESDMDVNALTANLLTKMKYTLAGRVYRRLAEKVDMTKSAIETRALREIADILTNTGKNSRGSIKIGGLNVPVADIEKLGSDAAIATYRDYINEMRLTTEGRNRILEEWKTTQKRLPAPAPKTKPEPEPAPTPTPEPEQPSNGLTFKEQGETPRYMYTADEADAVDGDFFDREYAPKGMSYYRPKEGDTVDDILNVVRKRLENTGDKAIRVVINGFGGTEANTTLRLDQGNFSSILTRRLGRLLDQRTSGTTKTSPSRVENTDPVDFDRVAKKINSFSNDITATREGNSVTLRTKDNREIVLQRAYGNNNTNIFDGVYAMGAGNGGGAGSKLYRTAWDALEASGNKYRPSNGLTPINAIRMTANMLKYVSSRKSKSAEHILLNARQQHGVPAELHNQPLTAENANKVAKAFKEWINRSVLPRGENLSARTSDAQLKEWGSRYGSDPRVRLGTSSLKLLRNFYRNNQTLAITAGLMTALTQQKDFQKLMEELDKNVQ